MTDRPLFSPNPAATDFFVGARLPFLALGLIRRSPALKRWTTLCAAVTLLSLLAVGTGAVEWAPRLVSVFFPHPSAWWATLLWQLAVAVCFLFLLFVGLSTVPLLMLAPFQDPLSEATERLWGAPKSQLSAAQATAVALKHTLARVALLWTGHAALLILNFVPAVGSVAWAALSILWSAYWNAGEYLDVPMARHGQSFSAVRALLAERRAATLGFGGAVYVLMWVPVLNLFFIPLAVVGGTLLFRGLSDPSAVLKL